ncbi:TPA: hypothetical protein DEO28_04855 [Candidatus Dependentiae bacterium]|nr:MAG: Efflux transporter, RND family, MFP subunit [candidate division TM6 bacterium GW2011_GWE2_31_21]KKP53881.1 MAG: Efflux transporter, RND family, MFP subunit [candidate division TM6 bacterium GW2011_GWF2_33_332]HBS47661.1 hypothetical protein [Candidatus Dependentiae bacterium]HBZ73810.1 hypothetical protein [Candidatus Dependentiae bacterium]
MFKNKIIIFSLVATIAIASSSFFYYKKTTKTEISLYQTVTPSTRDIQQFVNSSGTLKAKDQITVGSLVAGRVVKIYAYDNANVKKDQVLLEIDNGKGYSDVKRIQHLLGEAKAQQAYQEVFFKREKALYDLGQIAKNTFDEVTTNLNVAREKVKALEAQLEIAQQEYDNLFIKSPGDGVVIAKKIDLGQMITSVLQATELYIIAKDLTKMEINVDVDEADVGMLKEGQSARFTVDAFPKTHYSGIVNEVRYLSKIVENVVTYAAIIDVANPDLKLRPNMTADIYVEVANEKNALCVPNKALRINDASLEKIAQKLQYSFTKSSFEKKKGHDDFIWVVDGKAFKQILVRLGATDGKYTQIVTGLNKDSQVIIDITEEAKEDKFLQGMFKGKGGIG